MNGLALPAAKKSQVRAYGQKAPFSRLDVTASAAG